MEKICDFNVEKRWYEFEIQLQFITWNANRMSRKQTESSMEEEIQIQLVSTADVTKVRQASQKS